MPRNDPTQGQLIHCIHLCGECQVDKECDDERGEGDGRLVLPQPRVLVHQARRDRLEGAGHRRQAGENDQAERSRL